MKRFAMLLMIALTSLALAGPVSSAEHPLVGDPEVYTLVNLHPDESRQRLYTVNYLQAGLIPLCRKVKIESLAAKEMCFRVTESDRQYTYYLHSSLREPFPKHIERFFGKTCNKAKVQAMSKVDQEGILQGRALPGMTKEGVILAIGFPPDHATPNLEANAWRYWKNRFDTILVHFTDGKVTQVQD
jgi:hypothetical protein